MTRRIIIADDHPLFRAALRQAIERAVPDAEIVEVPILKGALEAAAVAPASLLCLDLQMGDSHGFAGLIQMRHEYAATPVVVVSASEDPTVIARAQTFGASGFIPKSTPLATIVEALSQVLEGETWFPEGAETATNHEEEDAAARVATLTPAQLRVLIGLSDGLLNKQIAYNMGISEATVKAHMTAVFRKLTVQNRTQAVILARTLNLAPIKLSDEA